jgi:hypothetical protein
MLPPLDRLRRHVGTCLPSGAFIVHGYEHWLACDATGMDGWSEGPAHPMAAYWATLAGMGVSLEELFALFEATSQDGIMAGETDIVVHRPLRVGESVAVETTILDLDRKQGARVGTFDRLRFRFDLVDADGATAATVEHVFIFPRRDTEG